MLLILALLFFPCAVVGAFVTTADDRDLLAFQSPGGLFSSVDHPLCGRPPAAAKDAVVVARSPGYSCASSRHRQRRAPAVTMLVNDASSLPSIRSLGSSGNHNNNPDQCNRVVGRPSSLLVWPPASAAGVMQDMMFGQGIAANSNKRRRGRGRAASGSEDSDSALRAMSIPARCALPSVDLLREAYGPRRSFWGDLSARETRIFYKELLPVSIKLEALAGRHLNDSDDPAAGDAADVVDLRHSVGESGTDGEVAARNGVEGESIVRTVFGGGVLTLEEQARLASTARHAARLYARERCALPSRVVAHLYDGLRHLKNYGTFRVTGMTWEELWAKYEAQVRKEHPVALSPADLKERVCLRILEKSCSTSQAFDNLAGLGGRDLETLGADIHERGESEILSATATAAAVAVIPVGGTAAAERAEACAANSTSEALERVSAVESAAAVAGALRLTRLVKPFATARTHEAGGRKERTRRRRERTRRRRERRPLGKPRFSDRRSHSRT